MIHFTFMTSLSRTDAPPALVADHLAAYLVAKCPGLREFEVARSYSSTNRKRQAFTKLTPALYGALQKASAHFDKPMSVVIHAALQHALGHSSASANTFTIKLPPRLAAKLRESPLFPSEVVTAALEAYLAQ